VHVTLANQQKNRQINRKMSHKTVILITGANGNTGKAVAQHVLRRADRDNYIVKVGARSQDKVADLVKAGAEFVQMDFNDKESLHAALQVRKYLTIC
jgi:uncharacterized protein YbjT (DUF2867 family)